MKGRIYGVSHDGSGVMRYDGLFGKPTKWIKIGGKASDLCVRGNGVYITDPQNGDVYLNQGMPFTGKRSADQIRCSLLMCREDYMPLLLMVAVYGGMMDHSITL